jgi:hypothetical protein
MVHAIIFIFSWLLNDKSVALATWGLVIATYLLYRDSRARGQDQDAQWERDRELRTRERGERWAREDQLRAVPMRVTLPNYCEDFFGEQS